MFSGGAREGGSSIDPSGSSDGDLPSVKQSIFWFGSMSKIIKTRNDV